MSKTKAALAAGHGPVRPGPRAAAHAEVDPKSILLTLPDHIEWKGDKVKSAVLYGDPKKPGSLYVMLLRWPPNWSTRPHSHPNDRMITVLGLRSEDWLAPPA